MDQTPDIPAYDQDAPPNPALTAESVPVSEPSQPETPGSPEIPGLDEDTSPAHTFQASHIVTGKGPHGGRSIVTSAEGTVDDVIAFLRDRLLHHG
jgi:hypothetical protein